MSDPYIGEIRSFGFNFVPVGWAQCNGQLLPIASNTALFSILGTTYGGDGKTTFALPNLQGNVVMGAGQGSGLSKRALGESGGTVTETLTVQQIPAHTHPANAQAGNGNKPDPTGNFWAQDLGGSKEYGDSGPAQMAPGTVTANGGGQAHNNLQPYLVLNFCIALQGVFPPRS
ncbi:MAG: phage tail protein [Proteobacteria bacterium SG_bin4]|nr:MAG: phage tail protein [Proteobacteria bacterium SG_bin4]